MGRGRGGLEISILGFAIDPAQRLQHRLARGEYTVCEQEGVEEINAQEAQVGEAVKESVHRRVTDLQWNIYARMRIVVADHANMLLLVLRFCCWCCCSFSWVIFPWFLLGLTFYNLFKHFAC